MPFIIICGFPCSGKSLRATQLKTYLEEKNSVVHIISEDEFETNKNECYSDPKKEKDLRSYLKSAVQRKISQEDVVILDSLNYIKGFRYELFCVTKSCQTPQCLVWCDVSSADARRWNKERNNEQYNPEVLEELLMRFEAPESRHRWDSPLFIVHADEELPSHTIYDALFHRKAPPPNMSTLSQPLSSTNFLHQLDLVTQEIVNVVVDAQKNAVPGDKITIPNSDEKVISTRIMTLAELQRCRRQFIAFTKTHPFDVEKIHNMFVHFLNNTMC